MWQKKIRKEKEAVEEKLKCKELEFKHSTAREEEVQKHLASMDWDFNKMLRGSHKLTSLLLQSKIPQRKLGLGGHNHDGEFY